MKLKLVIKSKESRQAIYDAICESLLRFVEGDDFGTVSVKWNNAGSWEVQEKKED